MLSGIAQGWQMLSGLAHSGWLNLQETETVISHLKVLTHNI